MGEVAAAAKSSEPTVCGQERYALSDFEGEQEESREEQEESGEEQEESREEQEESGEEQEEPREEQKESVEEQEEFGKAQVEAAEKSEEELTYDAWVSKMSSLGYQPESWIERHSTFIRSPTAIEKIKSFVPPRYQNLPMKYNVRDITWKADRLRCVIVEYVKAEAPQQQGRQVLFKIEGWLGDDMVGTFSVIKQTSPLAESVHLNDELNLLACLACRSLSCPKFEPTPISFIIAQELSEQQSALDSLQWDFLGNDLSFGSSFECGVLLWDQCWGNKHEIIRKSISELSQEMFFLFIRTAAKPHEQDSGRTLEIIPKNVWIQRHVTYLGNRVDVALLTRRYLSNYSSASLDLIDLWHLHSADLLRVFFLESSPEWNIVVEVFCHAKLVVSRLVPATPLENVLDYTIAPLAFRSGSPLPIHFFLAAHDMPIFTAEFLGLRKPQPLPSLVLYWNELWHTTNILYPKQNPLPFILVYSSIDSSADLPLRFLPKD